MRGRTKLQTRSAASSAQRSRITNGRASLPNTDHRSAPARRFKDVVRGLVEMNNGPMTLAEHEMMKRAAGTIVLIEGLEAKMIAGEPFDPDILLRANGSLRRTLADLGGLPHGQRDADDGLGDLDDYLSDALVEAHQAQQAKKRNSKPNKETRQ